MYNYFFLKVILPDHHYIRPSPTTPEPSPSGCVDLNPNCTLYPRDACSDYSSYTRKYCKRSCGLCPGFPLSEPACEDLENDCASFGTSMCYDVSQYNWVEAHCRKFCGFCGKACFIFSDRNFRFNRSIQYCGFDHTIIESIFVYTAFRFFPNGCLKKGRWTPWY